MEIKIDIWLWFGIFRMVVVGAVLIVLAANMNFFVEVFETVDNNVSALLLWAVLMMYALNFFTIPNFPKRKREKSE